MTNRKGRLKWTVCVLCLIIATLSILPGTINHVRAEGVTGTVTVGRNPDGISVDTSLNRIYVSNLGINGTSPSTVTVINGSDNSLLATIVVGVNPAGVAVNSVTHKAYVANYNSSSVSVINGISNSTTSITVGTHPSKVALNSASNEIFVTNTGDNTVSRINGTTNSIIGTIPVGRSPVGVSFLPSTNMFYVTNSKDGTVSVIDGKTHSVVKTVQVGMDPGNIASDTVTNLIYVVNSNSSSGTVSVIDGSSNMVVATLAVGAYPTGIDVNSQTNKIYVANSVDGTISIIDGYTDTVIDTVSLSQGIVPGVVGVNPVTNKIYVANGGRATLSVLSGHATGTSLSCNPSTLPTNGNTICIATVSDLSGPGASAPTALVFFSSNGQGIFNASSCTVTGSGTTASCSISYSPTAFGTGHQTIFATYSGDPSHMSSSTQTVISLVGSTVGGSEIPSPRIAFPLSTGMAILLLYLGTAITIMSSGQLRRKTRLSDARRHG